MIVLKATGNYVGYLIKAGTTSVSYSSPFINSQERTQNISHITFYGIKGGQQVPEPTTLALLGLGLMGAGMARRRKAQA